MLFSYSAYLDWQIRSKMDGQIWRLPAEVYSRIESIRVSDQLSFEQIKQLLLENEYRQTTMIAAPGDFKIEITRSSYCIVHSLSPTHRKRNGFFACVLKTTNWQSLKI